MPELLVLVQVLRPYDAVACAGALIAAVAFGRREWSQLHGYIAVVAGVRAAGEATSVFMASADVRQSGRQVLKICSEVPRVRNHYLQHPSHQKIFGL